MAAVNPSSAFAYAIYYFSLFSAFLPQAIGSLALLFETQPTLALKLVNFGKKLDPNCTFLMLASAKASIYAKDFSSASTETARLIEAFPANDIQIGLSIYSEDVECLIAMGEALAADHSANEALSYIDRALKIDSCKIEAFKVRQAIYSSMGDALNAKNDLERYSSLVAQFSAGVA